MERKCDVSNFIITSKRSAYASLTSLPDLDVPINFNHESGSIFPHLSCVSSQLKSASKREISIDLLT